MAKQVLHFDNGTVRADITIAPPSILSDMKRARLRSDAAASIRDGDLMFGDLDSETKYYLRTFSYPNLVAAAESGKLLIDGVEQPFPPSFEEFCLLPPDLGAEWGETVYKLCPGWVIKLDVEEVKKNVLSLLEESGVTSSTTRNLKSRTRKSSRSTT